MATNWRLLRWLWVVVFSLKSNGLDAPSLGSMCVMLARSMEGQMATYREALTQKLAELETQLNDMGGFVGFIGGADPVRDDSEELIRRLKDEIADIKSELEEMDDDA
jgi:cation transport ATPase